MQKKSAVLLGAGGRGLMAYGPYAHAHPEELEFVAVAEPQRVRRERFRCRTRHPTRTPV